MMEERWPWEAEESLEASDPFAHQRHEESVKEQLPRVVKLLPVQGTVMGSSSPHQTGDIVCYDILKRAPVFDLTSHFSDIQPKAPTRGAHRHISAPTLFCLSGRGWEINDGKTYSFGTYDMLVVPPFTIHQHGGDEDAGCQIFVPQSRLFSLMGLTKREQIKFGDSPKFPDGTEPLRDEQGKWIGYRIKKGVLGIKEDIDVMLGADQKTEGVFRARKKAIPWQGPVENTYDRYLKMFHDESVFCNTVTHVIAYDEQPWEWCAQGRLKWFTHPEINSAARRVWLYMQEIPPGSRSGKHRHMTEEQVLVIQGRGYDVHDGQRWEWERGDLVNIPAMAEHQHFNADSNHPALLLSSMPSAGVALGVGGIEQLEDAPEHSNTHRTEESPQKMAQKNRELHDGDQAEITAEHYYDYEARFVKQKREQERINILPRVIKPAMLANGEFALGDMRVFSRYTVAPLSMLTCGFLELGHGEQTEPRRMIPSLIAYIIEGSGESFQDGARFEFSAGDVVIIPPYTTYQFLAHPKAGFRAWLPQIRLWHGQGLLWRDPTINGEGGNESDSASEQKVAALFRSRREVRAFAPGRTRYDWFLSRLADENRVERENPRVIHATDRAWESTRQGRLKFYISRWCEVAASGLDVMAQEIAPGERSGEHRHIFEELLLVVKGRGYDLHEGTKHPWAEGDLICVPPMIGHQHVNDSNDAVQLVSTWPRQPGHELLGGIEQIRNASDRQR